MSFHPELRQFFCLLNQIFQPKSTKAVDLFLFSFLRFSTAQNFHKLTNKILISMSANQWFPTFFLLYSTPKVDFSFVLSESCQTAKSLDCQLDFQVIKIFSLFVTLSKTTFSPLTNKFWPKMKSLFFSHKSRNKSLQINAIILRFLSVRIMFVNTFPWNFLSESSFQSKSFLFVQTLLVPLPPANQVFISFLAV